VSALAFTPSLFTLEWTHPPNREQPAVMGKILLLKYLKYITKYSGKKVFKIVF